MSDLTQNEMRYNVYDPGCPSRQVLDHVTGRWGILVLGTLREGTRRFSELHRALGGVSEKMLAQTLRVLERDGLVHRVAYPVVPPKVEYSLTHRGREIAELTVRLVGWVEGNTPTIIAERTDRQGTV